jgi:hypothetical protein
MRYCCACACACTGAGDSWCGAAGLGGAEADAKRCGDIGTEVAGLEMATERGLPVPAVTAPSRVELLREVAGRACGPPSEECASVRVAVAAPPAMEGAVAVAVSSWPAAGRGVATAGVAAGLTASGVSVQVWNGISAHNTTHPGWRDDTQKRICPRTGKESRADAFCRLDSHVTTMRLHNLLANV